MKVELALYASLYKLYLYTRLLRKVLVLIVFARRMTYYFI